MPLPSKSAILEAYVDELARRYDWAFEDLARLEITLLEARKRLGIAPGHSLPMTGPAWQAVMEKFDLPADAGVKLLRGLPA